MLIPFAFFIINLIIHSYNLGNVVYVFTDEGVYLYSAKLLSLGLIPYKDFFLAQPLYLIYLISQVLQFVNFDLNLFHLLYIIWFFSLIFPIYFITLKLTNSRFAAVLSLLLLSTFTELVQWDVHFFALRQASLPFLAISLFFIIVKPKQKTAGIFLGLFALTLVQNLLYSLGIVAAILLYNYFYKLSLKTKFSAEAFKLVYRIKQTNEVLMKNLGFIFSFGGIAFLGYLLIYLLPDGVSNIVTYQLNRPPLPYLTRIEWLKTYTLPGNWPLLFTGFLGSIIILKNKMGFLGLANIIGILIVLFASKFYYPHYITILACGFTITAAILIAAVSQATIDKFLVFVLILSSIYSASFNHLKFHLIEAKSPDFFQTIEFLKNTPEPLFTFEPIYGLYAKKDLTYYYYVADMRYLRVMNKNLTDEDYLDIIKRSNTILIEPFAKSMLSPIISNFIQNNFTIIYQDSIHQIFVRNR